MMFRVPVAYLMTFIVGLLSAPCAFAQIRTVPQDMVDSIACPRLAEAGSLMEFATRHIAAEIGEDDRPVYEYRFVNRLDRTLLIGCVTTSCGCAVAGCHPSAVAPGESGVITVRYNPEGHTGKFRRRIFVYTDMSDSRPSAVLSLDVTVRPGTDRSRWFPHEMGRIRTKVKEFSFRSDMKDVVCLAFLNVSSSAVTPEVMEGMLPPYMHAWCGTPDVEPGGEGEICVSFDPEKFLEYAGGSSADRQSGSVRVPLVLTGLGVPPGASSIMIVIE